MDYVISNRYHDEHYPPRISTNNLNLSQVVTGWTNLLDIFYDDGSTADSTNSYFSSTAGTFTAPKAGWYNVCASLRFKKGGDNTDIVIVHVSAKRSACWLTLLTRLQAGSIVAAFGNAVRDDWQSTGTCLIREMTAGQAEQSISKRWWSTK